MDDRELSQHLTTIQQNLIALAKRVDERLDNIDADLNDLLAEEPEEQEQPAMPVRQAQPTRQGQQVQQVRNIQQEQQLDDDIEPERRPIIRERRK